MTRTISFFWSMQTAHATRAVLLGAGILAALACSDREPLLDPTPPPPSPTTAGATPAGPGGSSRPEPPARVPAVPEPASPACLAHAEGISLRPTADGTGAPSFSLAACRLAYVAEDGALRDRDLVTGEIIELSPASASPARPDRSPELVVWDADTEHGRRVHVRLLTGESLVIDTSYAQASEARVWQSTVVFTAFVGGLDGDSDVLSWDLATRAVTVVGGGAAQQRFPAISERYLAYSDFREGGEDGHYDPFGASLADIVVLDRQTGIATTRLLPGKQAFPLLGVGDVLGYLDWDAVRPEPKLGSQFRIRVGHPLFTADDRDVRAASAGTPLADLRPTLREDTFAWLERDDAGALRVLTRSSSTDAPATTHLLPKHTYAGMPLWIGDGVLAGVTADGGQWPRLTRVP